MHLTNQEWLLLEHRLCLADCLADVLHDTFDWDAKEVEECAREMYRELQADHQILPKHLLPGIPREILRDCLDGSTYFADIDDAVATGEVTRGMRLTMFAQHPIEVRRIALNPDQVTKYNPPPNPAKESDSRYAAYVREYGESSWELDALDPSVLAELVRTEVKKMIDRSTWGMVFNKGEEQREKLHDVINTMKEEL